MGITLNPVYKPILTTDKRIVIVTGGRGSSKSFSVNTLLCLTSYEQGHKFLFTRYAMNTADDSIIPEFREKIDLLERTSDFTINKNDIINKVTGCQFMFRGIKTTSGDQTAKLKSIQGLTDWILDEAEELTDEKKFDDIAMSVRSKSAKNTIILILNPTTKDHWIWKRWFENHLSYIDIEGFKIPVSNHPDILHIHTTYLDNLDHLDKDYIQELRNLKYTNPTKYRHKVLGGWLEKAEGVVFEEWEEGEFNEFVPHCYGLDFGFYPDPLAMVKVAVDKRMKTTYAKEVLHEYKLSTQAAVKAVARSLERKNDLIMCDSSEPRLYGALKSAGLNVHVAPNKRRGAKKSILPDIRDMIEYKLIVDPHSYNLKKNLNNYTWNDKLSDTPIDDYCDCFVAGTMVLTDSGNKPIEEVVEGDIVITENDRNEVVIKFNNGFKQVNEYFIMFGSFFIPLVCTPTHRIKTDIGWVPVSELHSGSTVCLNNDSVPTNTAKSYHVVEAVEVRQVGQRETFNLMIDTNHEYFANGILVSNCIDAARYGWRRLVGYQKSTGMRQRN